MANKVQILDKIERNMKQRGYEASLTRVSAEQLDVDGLEVSYREKEGDEPQIGVGLATQSGALGLGLGNVTAGSIQIEDTAQVAADAIDTAIRMVLLAECAGKANDIIILGTDGAANEIRIGGSADAIGLGE